MERQNPSAVLLRLRWRLAQLIAPRPIIASPGQGDGVWVVIRSGNALSTVKADSFRGKFTNGVGGRMRFVGTIKASNPLYDPATRQGQQQTTISVG